MNIGPFTVHVRSPIAAVANGIALLYADYPLAENLDFADFRISIDRPVGPRRWFRPQAILSFDGERPFTPSPLDQAFLAFEAGLNWLVSEQANQFMIIHAAGLEKDGNAVILPGPPGSGKSTLCAGLIARGWRLMSDELILIRPSDGMICPLVRPISLKNDSITLIRRYLPAVVLSRPCSETEKGIVAFMKPPRDSVLRTCEPARPAWLVFPKFVPSTRPLLVPISKARSFLMVCDNSFNYTMHGEQGFRIVARLIDACKCYELVYGDLEMAIAVFSTGHPQGPD